MKLILISLSLLMSGSSASVTSRKMERFTVVTHVPQVVGLYSRDGARCTGWVAGPHLIVTAGHCTDTVGQKILVKFIGGQMAVFEVVKRIHEGTAASANDMAALSGNLPLELPPLPIAENNAAETDSTPCVSIGLGEENIQKTTLCRTAPPVETKGLLKTFGAIEHGDSGGPVVDRAGFVIGVNEALTGVPIFYIVPASKLRAFLSGVPR